MFQTIGRTWKLALMSARVLRREKTLILFPILAFIAVAALVAIFVGIGFATGSLERLNAAMSNSSTTASSHVTIGDVALYVIGFVAVTYAIIFFNAALIAAALERLHGGNPTLGSGIRAIVPHMHKLLGWAIISATVGLILQAARSRTNSTFGRIALSLVGGVWAYLTFFVVPVLVVRGVGPVDAIRQSASLFKRTWGEQVVAGFGFGIFYILAGIVAVIPAALIFSVNPIAGVVVGVPLVALALGAVQATEGIFKAALYQYAAEGTVAPGFDGADLASSYAADQRSAKVPRGFV